MSSGSLFAVAADGHSTADDQRLQSAPGPRPEAMGITDEPMTGQPDAASAGVGAQRPSQSAAVDVAMVDAEAAVAAPSSHSHAARQDEQEPGTGGAGVWL